MSVSYEQLRNRFVGLCLTDLPERLRRERELNAPNDFDLFCADWRVREVAVKDSAFYFTTRRLAMQTPNDGMRWVGEFLVSINVKTKAIECEGNESRHNVTSKSVLFHPHVYGNKVPCFGAENILKLSDWFGDGKLGHIALYVLEFLCLARGVSHYYDPSNWPQLTLEEVEAWKRQQ